MPFRHLIARPAYAKQYDTCLACIADWNAGKDFYSIEHHRYFSRRDRKTLEKDFICGIIITQANGKTYTINF